MKISGMTRMRATIGTTMAAILPAEAPWFVAGVEDAEADGDDVEVITLAVGLLEKVVGAIELVSEVMGTLVAVSREFEVWVPMTADAGMSGKAWGRCGDRLIWAMITVEYTVKMSEDVVIREFLKARKMSWR